MIRTQVYLTNEQARDIKLRAKRERKPEAQVIREIVHTGLHARPAAHETAGRSLLRLTEIHANGPADASSRIDDYLYGATAK